MAARPPRIRLALVLLTSIALAATPAAIGASRSNDRAATAPAASPAAAPVRGLPARMPVADREHPGAYGFVPSARIATWLAPAPAARESAAAAAAAAGSATITVTATVLPVRTIVVDDSGAVVEVYSNTDDLRGIRSLYTVRRGALDGESAALTPAIWADARARMAAATAATGRIA